MELNLYRRSTVQTRTPGDLYVDGAYLCHTVEDIVRDRDMDSDGDIDSKDVEQFKVYGETAIPAGRYRLVLENSPKYGPDTLTIKDVPGFVGIRIHPGNTEKDTQGCLILGDDFAADYTIAPGTSRPAVARLKSIISPVIISGVDVWITIHNSAEKAI